MAKTKPGRASKSKSGKNRNNKDLLHNTNGAVLSKIPKKSTEELLVEAATLLQQSQPDDALPIAESALRRLETERGGASHPESAALPAILLLAEIFLELGNADSARVHFSRAAKTDPSGALISAEPFLWLAQLSEQGGEESMRWFQRATSILRTEIAGIADGRNLGPEGSEALLMEKKKKLAEALCAMAEVYMTDLSFDPGAEAACEALVTEALIVLPDLPSALQTLASVRISQLRVDDAQSALTRSMAVWETLAPEDRRVPDFPTRISLARLLMEVEMESRALVVIEGLIAQDDQSVEAWYLGGWCQVLLAGKDQENALDAKKGARAWLRNSFRLYMLQEYEDERLREHAVELVRLLDEELGVDQDDGDDEEWEEEEEDEAGMEDTNEEVETLEIAEGSEDADMT